MPRRPTLSCSDCGKPMWVGTGALPQGRCLECRRANPKRAPSKRAPSKRDARTPCADCGKPSYGECCHPCRSKRQVVRAADDGRLLRHQREHEAPGIRPCDRKRLLAKWKRQGKRCAYCDNPADTIDHAVPLVRGGTNYEGNLVPACKSCNSSKSGYLIAEWRTGKRLPRMTKAPQWKRKTQPIKAIKGEQPAFNVCPECGSLCLNRYCDSTCGTRYAMRRNYRLKVGIPLDAPLYQSDKPQWRRTWVA